MIATRPVTIRDPTENAVHDEGSSLDGGDVTLLAQQELVEPAPVRRLIVPRGHSAWWGVDPSTVRLSVAYVTPEGARGVRTVPFGRVEGSARLSEIYAQTRLFALGVAEASGGDLTLDPVSSEWPRPGLVLVEQPSGKMENPNLSYAVGVIQAALYDGLYSALGRAVRIETCTSGHWKKVACGRGNLYKPKRGHTFEYGVLTWARQNGYAGCSWDEADAWGIAEAARREVALEER
jgi:hypothetical protein